MDAFCEVRLLTRHVVQLVQPPSLTCALLLPLHFVPLQLLEQILFRPWLAALVVQLSEVVPFLSLLLYLGMLQ